LLRIISETEKARKELGGDVTRPFQDEQLFSMNFISKKCRICKNPGHLTSKCNMRKGIQSSAGQRSNRGVTMGKPHRGLIRLVYLRTNLTISRKALVTKPIRITPVMITVSQTQGEDT